MNQPQRFKDALGREGPFMKAGSDEATPTGAMDRAARQLGIFAPTLAAAISAEKARAATSGTATKLAASKVAATLAKGGLVGLGVGLVVLGAANLMHPNMPTRVAPAAPLVSTFIAESAPAGNSPVGPAVIAPAMASSVVQPGASTSRERLSASRIATSDEPVTEPNSRNGSGSHPLALQPQSLVAAPAPSNRTPSSVAESPAPADVRLAREVAGLDRVRALVNRGSAAAALEDLEDFEHRVGFSILQREAALVRIDILRALGRNDDASLAARQLLTMSPSGERARVEDLLRRKGVLP